MRSDPHASSAPQPHETSIIACQETIRRLGIAMLWLPVAFSFERQIVLNVVGPLTTVLVGGVIVGGLANTLARRAQQRRAQRELREQLVKEVTTVLAGLYMATQQFRRNVEDLKLPRESMHNMLTERYADARVRGTVLENQLEAYFKADEPKTLFHQIMDLLTVRYFQLMFSYVPYRENAKGYQGKKHSGLTEEELKDFRLIITTYLIVLPELCRAILREPLRPLAPGRTATALVRAWHRLTRARRPDPTSVPES